MKKKVRTLMLMLVFSAVSIAAVSQETSRAAKNPPRWLSDKGYWVIVGNVKTPKTNEIHFYNNANILIYSEKLTGVRLNPKNYRTCMRLKEVLDKSIIAYENSQPGDDHLGKTTFSFRK
jgi:hypothetical protein